MTKYDLKDTDGNIVAKISNSYCRGRFNLKLLYEAGLDTHNLDLTTIEDRNLSWTILDGVEFDETNFSGLDLSYSTFVRAGLANCNFTGCVLTGTDFTDAYIKGAIFDEGVVIAQPTRETYWGRYTTKPLETYMRPWS